MNFRRTWAGGVALLLAAGCAGEIDDPQALLDALDGSVGGVDAGGADAGGDPGVVACPTLGITDAYAELVQPSCAIAGCHGGGTMQGGLSLEGDLGLLVDQPANTPACDPLLLIDSSSAADSLMVQILESNPPCSSPMPFPTGGLSADEKACIEAWAEALAAQNP